MHDKLIDLSIEALKKGNSINDISDFIILLSKITIENTEIKSLQFGSGEVE